MKIDAVHFDHRGRRIGIGHLWRKNGGRSGDRFCSQLRSCLSDSHLFHIGIGCVYLRPGTPPTLERSWRIELHLVELRATRVYASKPKTGLAEYSARPSLGTSPIWGALELHEQVRLDNRVSAIPRDGILLVGREPRNV